MTMFDAIEDALRKDDWWKQLVTIIGVPAILGFFAYSYAIGYFMASDIAWFTFFSLSDHVRFAIRSLPLVAAASIVFLTVYSNWDRYRWLEWPWLIVLISFAAWSVYTSHIVIGIIIGLMVLLEVSRRLYKSFIQPPHCTLLDSQPNGIKHHWRFHLS